VHNLGEYGIARMERFFGVDMCLDEFREPRISMAESRQKIGP
jgi:hypothetical protein